MRYSRLISIINGLLLSSNVVAMTLSAFSPYVDLTLNTHWDLQSQSLAPMDLTTPALNHHIKEYHLAFITDSGVCEPAWGGQKEYQIAQQWGKQETDRLFANGVGVNVSFGGANGNDISWRCGHHQLVTIFNDTIRKYHANALDFDIENGTADVPKLLQSLQVIQKQHPEIKLSFTLPVMPEGLTSVGKEIVRDAQKAGLHFRVNIMAMDYGPAYNGDMGEYAISAATHLHQFLQKIYPEKTSQELWALIEVTPMIGVNDVNTEQFTLQNADHLKDFAYQNHLSGLSMWSFNRDKPCADKWASPVCSGAGLQQYQYEFVSHFQ